MGAFWYYFQKDYDDMVETLKEASTNKSTKHDIDKLLKETFTNRRLEVAKIVGRPVYKMCNKFPALKKGHYVSKLFGNWKGAILSDKITKNSNKFWIYRSLPNLHASEALVWKMWKIWWLRWGQYWTFIKPQEPKTRWTR